MKNKKLLYVLIPGTLIVWGIIIYKVFRSMNTGESPMVHAIELDQKKDDQGMNDTFSINPHYRDPFLGKMNKRTIDNPQTVKATVPKVTKAVAPWPNIVFGGIIKNQKSNKQLALVQINGQGYTMKTGEIINDVQLNKIYKDSIEVKFQKEKKFVSK
ncbi:MAG: hypothetical protein ACT4ON_01495 [Bacteroidota bacterium]